MLSVFFFFPTSPRGCLNVTDWGMRGLKPLDILKKKKVQLIKTRSGDDESGSLKLKWQQSDSHQPKTHLVLFDIFYYPIQSSNLDFIVIKKLHIIFF